MKRARVVTLNAALGPLDYRVPEGMAVEPGSIVVAPLGPAPIARRRLGRGTAADQRSARQPAAAARRRARRAADCRAASPFVRMDGGLLSLAAGLGVADGAALIGRARWPATADRVSADGRSFPTASLRSGKKRLPRCEGRQGTIRELADHAEVSDAVCAVWSMPARWKRSPSTPTAPSPAPILIIAPPDLNDDQRDAAASLAGAVGKGFDPVLLDGVTGSGKTEVYFEAIAECLRQGKQALVLLPGDRAHRAFPETLRSAVRLSRPSLGTPDLAPRSAAGPGAESPAAKPRSRSERARHLFLPYSSLGLIVVDEAHEPSFKQEDGVQYHARDTAVMRAQVRGHSGHPLDGNAGDRKPAHGRAWAATAKSPARSASPEHRCRTSARST